MRKALRTAADTLSLDLEDAVPLAQKPQARDHVAAFLRDLAGRYAERGQSPNEFTLPMAREDIGNYLGLTLETVSRCFSRLKHAGVLDVDNRHIRIRDAQRLLSGAGSYRQTSNGVVTH